MRVIFFYASDCADLFTKIGAGLYIDLTGITEL
jgi:hypothetical protein